MGSPEPDDFVFLQKKDLRGEKTVFRTASLPAEHFPPLRGDRQGKDGKAAFVGPAKTGEIRYTRCGVSAVQRGRPGYPSLPQVQGCLGLALPVDVTDVN